VVLSEVVFAAPSLLGQSGLANPAGAGYGLKKEIRANLNGCFPLLWWLAFT